MICYDSNRTTKSLSISILVDSRRRTPGPDEEGHADTAPLHGVHPEEVKRSGKDQWTGEARLFCRRYDFTCPRALTPGANGDRRDDKGRVSAPVRILSRSRTRHGCCVLELRLLKAQGP